MRRWSLSALVLAAVLTTVASAQRAEPATWAIVPQAGGDLGMTFTLGWTLGTHEGRASRVSGSLLAELDPLRIVQGEFRVPIASMSTGSASRDCHMREALGIDYSRSRFPREHVCVNDRVPASGPDSVTFPDVVVRIRGLQSSSRGTSSAPLRLAQNQPVDAQMLLGISIHGVTQDLLTPVHLQLDAAQRVRVSAEFDVRLAAFEVVVLMPRLMSVQDRARVKLSLLLGRT